MTIIKYILFPMVAAALVSQFCSDKSAFYAVAVLVAVGVMMINEREDR